MKLDDLDTIRDLAEARTRSVEVLERVKLTSPRLVLGHGSDAVDILMPPTLQKLINESVAESLTERITETTAQLRDLGVEV